MDGPLDIADIAQVGNGRGVAGTPGRTVPTSSQTNRLNSPATAYDTAGNLTSWNGAVYQYDRFNQMIGMKSGSEDWAYIYTADDERFWSYKPAANFSRWTLRDLGGKVLREYLSDGGRWSVGTDYLYRDGSLLAAETQTGRRHYHLDHLGTPRLITRASGYKAAYHVYYPFGEELTAFNQDTERMKFTGHERDLGSPAGAGDDLDYMHARHCSPVTGRFLSIDPTYSVVVKRPQTWNFYSYVRGNPLLFNDPDGREERKGWQAGTVENRSSRTIYIAASREGKEHVVISLKSGERSSDFIEDTDSVVVREGQAIDGERSGAYKVGPSDLIVEEEDGSLVPLNLLPVLAK